MCIVTDVILKGQNKYKIKKNNTPEIPANIEVN